MGDMQWLRHINSMCQPRPADSAKDMLHNKGRWGHCTMIVGGVQLHLK